MAIARSMTKEIRIGQSDLLRMLRCLREARNEERVGSSLGSPAFSESMRLDSLIQSIESLEPTYHYFIRGIKTRPTLEEEWNSD